MSEKNTKAEETQEAGESAETAPKQELSENESLPETPTGESEALEEAKKELLYLRAEFDNFRKRMQREQEQKIRFANEGIIGELVNFLDNLRRAVAHGEKFKTKKNEPELLKFLEGIEMAQRDLIQTLSSRYAAELTGNVGDPFDPAKHEAISQIPTAEFDENAIVEVLEQGCLIHGRIIKPAKVVVAKAAAPVKED